MRTNRIVLLAVIAGSAFYVACADEPSGFPEVEGWAQAGEVRVYDAETLWEYINGAAELFVEYGVRTCTTGDLSAGEVSATVDLYDMGSPLNAVGVFNRESAGGGLVLPRATQAAISPPYQALLVKGSTYVKVNVFEGELSEAAGRELLEGLAASLPGEAMMPQEFSLLPREGMVAGSEGYQPGSLLGLSELTDCLYAEYEGGEGETWEGFVVLPSAASAVWDRLAARWESLEHGGTTVLYREVPYSGLVGVMRTDAGMFGVSGAGDEAQLRERLEGFTSVR